MQNTRLNNLVEAILGQLTRSLRNPWRRVSVILIGLLLGVFMGTAIPTTAGQSANWDVIGAGVLVLFAEAVNRSVYGSKWRSLLGEVVNAFKIGLTYSLFIEAFKLGS